MFNVTSSFQFTPAMWGTPRLSDNMTGNRRTAHERSCRADAPSTWVYALHHLAPQ
jgi:hypothetical protein